MCAAILRSVRGIEVHPEYLDLEVTESVVTGDGHYLGHEQTLELMRTEYVYPELGDRASVAEWIAGGESSIWDRAQARVAEITSAGSPGHLPPEAEAAIRARFDIELPKHS